MRSVLAVALLVLLAGCSESPPGASPLNAPQATDASAADPLAPGDEAEMPDGLQPLAFGVTDQETSMVHEGTFPAGQQCMIFFVDATCEASQRIDLTPIVAVGIPTQVVVTLLDDSTPGAGIDLMMEVQGGSFSEYDDGGERAEGLHETTVMVALQPGGTLTAVVEMFFPSLLPPQDTHYTLEARGVVRSTVLPTFLPVAVELGPGESLVATGEGLEDFIIVPPGGSPIHHLGPFQYNASADAPRGRHVVVAKGDSDVTLYGPAGRNLEVLPLLQQVGEPRAVASGQEVAWDFTVPGVPLYVGLRVESQDQASGFAVAPFHGNYQLTLARAGAELLSVTQDGCLTPCQFSLLASGYSNYWGAYLDEKLGDGSYHASARFETTNGYQVRDLVAYVQP